MMIGEDNREGGGCNKKCQDDIVNKDKKDKKGGGNGGGSAEAEIFQAIYHAIYYNPTFGGSSSGCNTWMLTNTDSNRCHHTLYTPKPICLAIFHCSPEEQKEYASRFQYPGQGPWNPVVGTGDRSVMGGDFFPGSALYRLGAVRTQVNGSTMTNFTYPTHIFYDGQIDRTISEGYVTTEGHGTNTKGWVAFANQYGGPLAFELVDDGMLAFSTVDQVSGGALVELMDEIP